VRLCGRKPTFSCMLCCAVLCSVLYLCVPCAEPSKINALLPIGGPGKALSAKEQADILFR
jgi:hypothetical protein